MHLTFDNLVEEIKSLSTEEKEELEFLLEKFLIEERREEIQVRLAAVTAGQERLDLLVHDLEDQSPDCHVNRRAILTTFCRDTCFARQLNGARFDITRQ